MVGLEPMVKDGQRFTQRETAKILGVHHITINRWEKLGLMAPGRPIGNRKWYYGREIKRCWKNYFRQIG